MRMICPGVASPSAGGFSLQSGCKNADLPYATVIATKARERFSFTYI